MSDKKLHRYRIVLDFVVETDEPVLPDWGSNATFMRGLESLKREGKLEADHVSILPGAKRKISLVRNKKAEPGRKK